MQRNLPTIAFQVLGVIAIVAIVLPVGWFLLVDAVAFARHPDGHCYTTVQRWLRVPHWVPFRLVQIPMALCALPLAGELTARILRR